MKFDEALHRFKMEIEREYGSSEGLLKITLSHKLFDDAIISLWRDQTMFGGYAKMSYTPSSMSDLKLDNVRIEARAALSGGFR